MDDSSVYSENCMKDINRDLEEYRCTSGPAFHTTICSSSFTSIPLIGEPHLLPTNMNDVSFTGTVFSLANATLGIGCLSVPFAIHQTGLPMGFLILVVTAWCSLIATECLTKVMQTTNLENFAEMAQSVGGPGLSLFVELCMILWCFGTGVGYLISLGDILDVLGFHANYACTAYSGTFYCFIWTVLRHRHLCLCIFCFAVLLPICLFGHSSLLRISSFLSVFVSYLVVLMVGGYLFVNGMAFSKSGRQGLSCVLIPTTFTNVFRAASIILFAFSCQANIPTIFSQLENRSSERMGKVSLWSAAICFFAYFVIGICGFLTFGTDTNENILLNYQTRISSPLVLLTFVAMFIAVITAYPINMLPCRYTLESLVMVYFTEINNRTSEIVVGALSVILTLICALSFPSVSLTFEILGCSCGPLISFILPGYFANVLLSPVDSLIKQRKPIAVMCFGIVVGLLGTFKSFSDIRAAFNLNI